MIDAEGSECCVRCQASQSALDCLTQSFSAAHACLLVFQGFSLSAIMALGRILLVLALAAGQTAAFTTTLHGGANEDTPGPHSAAHCTLLATQWAFALQHHKLRQQ